MENILVVLAIIGSVVYKIYTSYKEEMEKAAKRRQPVAPVPTPTPPQQRRQVPIPPPVVPSKSATTPVKKTSPVVAYEAPSEVKKIQSARVERETRKTKQVQEHPSDTERIHFDLRQAVIQSTILERPYK